MSFIDILWINGVAYVFAMVIPFIIFMFIDDEAIEDIIWYVLRYIIWMWLIYLIMDISFINFAIMCVTVFVQSIIIVIAAFILATLLYCLCFGASDMRAMVARMLWHQTALSFIGKGIEVMLISYLMWLQLS